MESDVVENNLGALYAEFFVDAPLDRDLDALRLRAV